MSSITSQQDRSATIAAEQSVAERVVYTAPAGDTAVIRSRGLFTYDSAATSYTPGKVIYVDVASRTHVLDTSRSFFSFNIKYQISTGDPANGTLSANSDAATDQRVYASDTVAYNCSVCWGLAGNEWAPPTCGGDLLTANPIAVPLVRQMIAGSTIAETIAATTIASTVDKFNVAIRRRKWWRKDGDSNNIVSSLRVLTRRGTAMESVNFYNHLAHTLQHLTMTEEEKNAVGKITGHGAYPYGMSQYNKAVSDNLQVTALAAVAGTTAIPTINLGALPDHVHIFGKQNFVVGTEYGATRVDADLVYQAAHFALDLRASGLWNMPQFIPIYLLEGVRFEFTLAPFLTAFKGSTIPAASGADQEATSYLITNFKLYAEMVELAAPVKVALQAAVQQGGLPLMVPSYAVMQFSPSSSTTVTMRVTERLSHATAVFIWAAALASSDNTTNGYVSVFDHQHMKPTYFQIRVGQASIPDQPLQVASSTDWRDLDLPLYNLLRGAIGTLGPASKEFLPIYDRWAKLKAEASATITERGQPNNFSYYTLGVSLQTSPGVDGSGMIIGDLADLVIHMKVATALEGSGFTSPNSRSVYVAIAHDRLVQVMDGGLINVTA